MKRILRTLSTAFILILAFLPKVQAQCPGTTGSTKISGPFTITFQEIKITGGRVRLTFDVQNTAQTSNFEFVAFELPEGAGAVAQGPTYRGAQQFGGTIIRDYAVDNPSISPNSCVKFYGCSDPGSFKRGKSDVFSYEMSAYEFANMSSLTVTAGAANQSDSKVVFNLKDANNQPLACLTSVQNSIAGFTVGTIDGLVNPMMGSLSKYSVASNSTLSYLWYGPDDWTLENKNTNPVDMKVGAKAGTIWVETQELGSGSSSNPIIRTMAVYPFPNPLPVELVKFNGVAKNGAIDLTWSTATEINNDRFEVERSANGKDFLKIGEVKGAGNSSLLLNYQFFDNHPLAGTVYYRLKQLDIDGTREYSKVISVKSNLSNATFAASLYPNPVNENYLTVKLINYATGNDAIVLKMTDLSGKAVLVRNLSPEAQESRIDLQSCNLRKGMYLVSVSMGDVAHTQRIMIQ